MRASSDLMREWRLTGVPIIEQRWGTNKTALFNLVARELNRMKPDRPVGVVAYKNLGLNSVIVYFEKRGLRCRIVAKGDDGQRLIECYRSGRAPLEITETNNPISFTFGDRTYHVDTGNAIFSKSGLDEGTRVLLTVFFKVRVPEQCRVIDFGAGWGAIALVIATELPACHIVAVERDAGAVAAAKHNLAHAKNVTVIQSDIFTLDLSERFDFVLSNPPFHSTSRERDAFFNAAISAVKPSGKLFIVTGLSFTPQFKAHAARHFELDSETVHGDYSVSTWSPRSATPELQKNRGKHGIIAEAA